VREQVSLATVHRAIWITAIDTFSATSVIVVCVRPRVSTAGVPVSHHVHAEGCAGVVGLMLGLMAVKYAQGWFAGILYQGAVRSCDVGFRDRRCPHAAGDSGLVLL